MLQKCLQVVAPVGIIIVNNVRQTILDFIQGALNPSQSRHENRPYPRATTKGQGIGEEQIQSLFSLSSFYIEKSIPEADSPYWLVFKIWLQVFGFHLVCYQKFSTSHIWFAKAMANIFAQLLTTFARQIFSIANFGSQPSILLSKSLLRMAKGSKISVSRVLSTHRCQVYSMFTQVWVSVLLFQEAEGRR